MSSIIVIRNNLKNFSVNNYKNTCNIDLIEKFLYDYSKIQKQDSIKPIFMLTKKYSNYSNKKKQESKWKKYVAETDVDKVKEIIKSNLNKISKDNFNIISKKLILDIKKMEKGCALNIIVDEIYEKTVFDIKFQNIYLETIKIIWSDRTFYRNLVNIKKENNKFFWKEKEKKKVYGPFDNQKILEQSVFNELSLKKLFMNKLQEEFEKRDVYMKMLDDDSIIDNERFKVKRNLFGLYELLVKLYYSRDIPIFFINYVLFTLFKEKENVYYLECIHLMLNLFTGNKEFNYLMNFEKEINSKNISSYLESIRSINKETLTSRFKFVKLDIEDYLTKFSGIFKGKNIIKSIPVKKEEIDFDKFIKDNLMKDNFKKITFMLKDNNDKMEDNLLTLFDYLFEYQDKKGTVVNVVSFLLEKKHISKDLLNGIYSEIDDNLEDLALDFSNIREFFSSLKNDISSSVSNH